MDGPVLPGAQLAVPGASALGLSSSDTPPFDDSFYDAVVAELYGLGGYSPDYLTSPNGSALIEETNRVLMDGVSKGVSSITEEPDPAFSAALAQNTFIFSGFKTHQELQEVNSLLRDKDGKLRPFDEFKRDVDKLGKEYNQNYLRAEYNHAVQSAQMAAKWQEFQKHKDFVNLQYRTANDERVRAEHAALHGTTLPVDDKFWTKYLPPLGWNCRCTVVEVLKDSYPESNSDEAVRAGDSATSRPAEKIFRFNPGKELKVFPPKHPYLPKGCSSCALNKGKSLASEGGKKGNCEECKLASFYFSMEKQKKNKQYAKNKKDYEHYKGDNEYVVGEFTEKGGYVAQHKSRIPNEKTDKNEIQKYDKEIKMCEVFAKLGFGIDYKEDVPGEFDVYANGKKADLKQTKGTGNIEKKARYAIEHQGAEIVLQCLETGIDRTKALAALSNLWHIDKIRVYYYFQDEPDKLYFNGILPKNKKPDKRIVRPSGMSLSTQTQPRS